MALPVDTSPSAADHHSSQPGWIHSGRFDAGFIVGLALVGLISAAVVVARPSLWAPIFFADIWLLGYHHVVSTYSRLGLDAQARREHRWMITWLPVAVLIVVAATGYGLGGWTLATTYFYWQWWHYARQSWGVSRIYERKAEVAPPEDPRLAKAVFYLVPTWGILWRSAQSPSRFLGVELKTLPVPAIAAHLVGVAAGIGLAWLVVARFRAWRAGRLPLAQSLYLATHYIMFATAYVVVDSVDFGWLAINIWHNAQYILFVWYFNNQRAARGAGVESPVLSWLSQTRRFGIYMLVSVAASSVMYVTLRETVAVIIAPIVVYQAVNFHHYIVDSFIWKVRAKPMQQTLGLATGR